MDKINQSEVNVTLNNKLNLTCNVESYPPAMVHWVVNGEQVSDVASVMVNTSVRGAIDTYTCVAVNEVNGTNRSASNSIDVIIQGKILYVLLKALPPVCMKCILSYKQSGSVLSVYFHINKVAVF